MHEFLCVTVIFWQKHSKCTYITVNHKPDSMPKITVLYTVNAIFCRVIIFFPMQKGEQRVTMHVVEETSTNDHICCN